MTATLSLRGLMLDAARLVESLDYYRRFLDFCAGWRINAVIFRLTDDQGCAMRFRSHPELITHPNALTPANVGELARYAAERGVELIPEVQSFGHSHYITQTPEHADLDDQGTDGPSWANGLIPLHPKTLRILGDLYTEAAALTTDWQAGRAGDPRAGLDQAAVWGFGPEDWLHARFLAAAIYSQDQAREPPVNTKKCFAQCFCPTQRTRP